MTTTDGAALPPAPVTRQGLMRVGLHVLLAALPLLAISAHVFGLITMNWSAALLVIPLATTILALSMFDPHPEDRVILHGFVWGIVACGLYDVFRLDTVYMLGWWADFIPTMGTWIVGKGASPAAGAWVGYLWRYLGDGGGIGVTFFVLSAFLGLHRRSAPVVVAASVGFAVFPVWSGLIATVWLAPRGQTMMFPLTPVTITLSLIGHLIFGLILGLGFVRTRSAHRYWPWNPVVGRFAPADAPEPANPFAADADGTLRVPHPARSAAVAERFVTAAPPTGPLVLPARVVETSGSERSHVVPPPPLPAGHPSAPFPRAHPSGPLPVPAEIQAMADARAATGALPVTPARPVAAAQVSAVQVSAAQVSPAQVSAAQPEHPRTGSGPVPVAAAAAVRTTSGSASGAIRTTGSSGTDGSTLDPETWASWQRQLATTVKGRRTHRWR